MKNIFIKKLSIALFFILGVISYAQRPPVPGEGTESGDIGDQATAPIDDYVIWLLLLAVVFLVAFARLKAKQLKNI